MKQLAAAALAGALLASTSVYAGQFTGTLSLGGPDSWTDTSVTFSGPANIGASSGDFAAKLGTCIGCVTMASFNASSVNFSPYDAVNNGNESQITLADVTFVPNHSGPLDSLEVKGSGWATLTDFDPTFGFFDLTTQGLSGNGLFTFSSTTIAAAVSEPGTLALLGAALIGLGFCRRRKGEVRPQPDCATAI